MSYPLLRTSRPVTGKTGKLRIHLGIDHGTSCLEWQGNCRKQRYNGKPSREMCIFLETSLKREYFQPQQHHIHLHPWKGQARYLNLLIEGQDNRDAAWYYPDPKPAAQDQGLRGLPGAGRRSGKVKFSLTRSFAARISEQDHYREFRSRNALALNYL